ncbi:unnamed protein product [Phytomonas sp. Hart1]|nr:unnamed protein product [Phytomonas sp. Hart1]|eukprot:CCW70251.1 unnamed protein product [Phytomonas sp. isolate Hart1]
MAKEQVENEFTFQSLPIKVNFHGTTDVRENFDTFTTVDAQSGELRNAFRGRTLVGMNIVLPENYNIALVDLPLHSADELYLEGKLNKISRTETFQQLALDVASDNACSPVLSEHVPVRQIASSYVLWEHDKRADKADILNQWIELAKVIHT